MNRLSCSTLQMDLFNRDICRRIITGYSHDNKEYVIQGEMNGMHARIEGFVNEVKKKNHIMQLVDHLDLCLEIEADNVTNYLYFKKNRIEFRKDELSPTLQYAKLSGKSDDICDLLDGKIKLRDGINIGCFNLVCPFRTLLVLESIFYLAKPMFKKVFI